MTTAAAERQYLGEHLSKWRDHGYAVHNPHGKEIDELPLIYGFNNGGSPGWYSAVLISADGEGLGGHVCSHEGYMLADLGILDGSRPDRHEAFRKHYPDGYRMDFVSYQDVSAHAGLKDAFRLHDEKHAAPETGEAVQASPTQEAAM